MSNKIKEISLLGILATILFVQEQALTFLPNVQLTVFLFILFSKKLGLSKTLIILTLYVILDNLVLGSFSIIFTPFMFIGWAVIPLTLCTIFRKIDSPIILALLSIVYAFIYSWIYFIPNMIVYKHTLIAFLTSDILFEIVLAASSFISVLWLYSPLSKLFDKINFIKQ